MNILLSVKLLQRRHYQEKKRIPTNNYDRPSWMGGLKFSNNNASGGGKKKLRKDKIEIKKD